MMSALSTFLFFLTLALAIRIAGAQPVIAVRPSIELRVAQAQFVIRGTIANLSRTVLVPPNGYVTNAMRIDGKEKFSRTQMPDGIASYTITVKVDEVIKGPRRTTGEFIAETSARDDEFEHWAARRASFLCFGSASRTGASDGKPLASRWDAISLGPPGPGEQVIGMVDFPPVLSMDFACLDDPNEILSRARRFAQAKEKVAGTHVFEHPPLPANRTGFLWTRLAVPVVPSLETTARRLIQSPGDYARLIHGRERETLLHTTRDMLRAEGVAALRYFESKKNIALLKTLLHDPAFTLSHHRDDRSDAKRVYYVRKAAYETLQGWNIEVPSPVLEEPAP